MPCNRRSRSNSRTSAPISAPERLRDLRSGATSSCLRVNQKSLHRPCTQNPPHWHCPPVTAFTGGREVQGEQGDRANAIAFETALGRDLRAQARPDRLGRAAGQLCVLGAGASDRGARLVHAGPVRSAGRRAAGGAQRQARTDRAGLRRALCPGPAVGSQPAGLPDVLGGDRSGHFAARHRRVRRWLALVPTLVRPRLQIAVRAADRSGNPVQSAPQAPGGSLLGAAPSIAHAGAAAAGNGGVPVAVRRGQPGDRELAGRDHPARLRLDLSAAPDRAGLPGAAHLGRAAPAPAAPHFRDFRWQRRSAFPGSHSFR